MEKNACPQSAIATSSQASGALPVKESLNKSSVVVPAVL